MAHGSNAYGVENMTGSFGATAGAAYYVPRAGMSAICDGLHALVESRVEVHTNTRVCDLTAHRGQYRVSAISRHKDNTFQAREFSAEVVLLTSPPSAVEHWASFAPSVQPVLTALESVPLFKCFCRSAAAFQRAARLPPKVYHPGGPVVWAQPGCWGFFPPKPRAQG